MAISRLGTTLLLACTCLLMRAVDSTERALTCDDSANVQRLSCDIGVISVQEALYGRTDTTTCSEGRPAQQLTNTKCSQRGTVDVLRTRCDGKKTCEVNMDVFRTSDPCRGIFKYLDTNYTCVPAFHVVACEQSFVHLHCDQGQVIFVYGADYGRQDKTTCSFGRPNGQVQNTVCSGSASASRVADRCNGKQSCVIRSSNRVFGDPCVGTYKYLQVAYVCEFPVFSGGPL